MTAFEPIYQLAIKRKGGKAKLNTLMPTIKTSQQLKSISDDRYLSAMTRCINNAGFNWTVISNKWPQFEEAFFGFDPSILCRLSDEQWEAYTKDKRVVRNWQKIKAVKENVYLINDIASQHGSFANFIAGWPDSDYVGLLQYLKKHGSRLGGNSGGYFLRQMGKDSFLLSNDVISALQNAGVDITDKPSSQRDMKKIQQVFNQWKSETGLSLAQLSRICGYSIGKNLDAEYITDQMEKFDL